MVATEREKKHVYIKVPKIIHIDVGLFLWWKKKILLKGVIKDEKL